jgi:ketosteroid isomerase-like protein
VSAARSVVEAALTALQARDWEGLTAVLDPYVVHRTPGVPDPILGREAFLHMSREAVVRAPDISFTASRIVTEGQVVVVEGEWRYTGLSGLVRQPSISVIEVHEGLIVRDEEYLGLAY